ncbi:hypothetical protein SAMN05428985_106160 [Nocardioides sp. YR527]|uniref:hypothetical protein n=1 Tax=Nocardioides sp. YR527 TaxID=1881028 RepID=UPI0008908B12|nr:hypothetical protein [Nocardioides sp. YR527]SDK80681.1 hypothetical protein SAMN05428985_106160 [Nocardioides sp. YR527]
MALSIWMMYAAAVAVALAQLGSAPADRPLAPGSPAALIQKHDCWSAEAPRDMTGRLPAHAIVATGPAPRYVDANLTGKALDQVFTGEDHGLVVYAFCR